MNGHQNFKKDDLASSSGRKGTIASADHVVQVNGGVVPTDLYPSVTGLKALGSFESVLSEDSWLDETNELDMKRPMQEEFSSRHSSRRLSDLTTDFDQTTALSPEGSCSYFDAIDPTDTTALTGAISSVFLSVLTGGLPVALLKQAWVRSTRGRRRRRRPSQKIAASSSGLPCRLIPSAPTSPSPGVRGIRNYGQTCFLNSTLQSLSGLQAFHEYVERVTDGASHIMMENEENETQIVDLTMSMLRSLNTVDGSFTAPDPRDILRLVATKNPQFESRYSYGSEQQDAHELLQAMVSMIMECTSVSADFYPRFGMTMTSSGGDAAKEQSLSDILHKLNQHDEYEEPPERVDATNPKLGHELSDTTTNDTTRPIFSSAVPLDELFATLEDDDKKLYDDETKSRSDYSVSVHQMLQTTSATTPTPLHGWLGSTLQCCSCGYKRPIQNTPFLDIPVVPTSITEYLRIGGVGKPTQRLPACHLTKCLANYTSSEIVGDVECAFCTIQREILEWEEEVSVLRGAVKALTNNHGPEGLTLAEELTKAEKKLQQLEQMDPEDLEELQLLLRADDEDISGLLSGEANSTKRRLVRGNANKRLVLTRPPAILCIHVQRRFYDPMTTRMSKTLQQVDFDEYLNLSPYCNNSNGLTAIPYKLQAVVEHQGNAFSGHYQTYRRRPDDWEKWVLVSDLDISARTFQHVKSSQAYMLFYEATE